MTFLSEDPTYLAGFLVLAAGAFLMALKVTQQGKYLVWALTALGLAVAVVVIERMWVTDNERIESVVYDLRRAVLAADRRGCPGAADAGCRVCAGRDITFGRSDAGPDSREPGQCGL